MSRTFFSTTATERKRQQRAAEREKILTAVVQNSDDDNADDEMDVSEPHPLSIDDQSFSHNLFPTDDIASDESNNSVSDASSSEDDDADVEGLVHKTDVNHQRKIYANSFLSIYDACQIIIKLSRRLNLDKSKTNILLQGIRSLLPNDNKLPRTIIGLMKILRE
jgi:hypothetical protein